MSHAQFRRIIGPIATAATFLLCLSGGCGRSDDRHVQGYVEGEFVHIASPVAGALTALHVQRGAQVSMGQALFALEAGKEQAARDEAAMRLTQANARWEDLKKGMRASEIEALEAQLSQAKAALAFSEKQLERLQRAIQSNAASPEEFDRARFDREEDQARVQQLEADLKTARLGARLDQIEAAGAEVRAFEAALVQANWTLSQKTQLAPQDGVIFDTLYQEGEWIAAGRPVVVVLPPQNIKVRAFVPEARLATIEVGNRASVIIDGTTETVAGKVAFISPKSEFTPPVIYSRESRSKLVFMVEISFEVQTASKLHPGQPVDVEFEP